MQIKIKAGTDLTSDERGDLGMLLRQFDTYAPTPRDPKTSLPFEGVLESGQVHPERFRFFNISNQNTYFIVYDDDGRCIASATAVVAVTSRKAQVTIEDVVVLPAMRNTGIGNTLMAAVVTWVKSQDMYYFIQLTCSPKRGEWVNLWFMQIGFELVACADPDKTGPHATNLYRMSLVN